MTRRARSERGAATVLVVAGAGVLLLVAGAVAGVVGLVHAHRTAQAAADLAALAGATEQLAGGDGCGRAGVLAEANGAALVRCRATAAWLEVEVEVAPPAVLGTIGTLRAVARAGPDLGGTVSPARVPSARPASRPRGPGRRDPSPPRPRAA
ncbi:Rv3654c family TadE-like protein [Nocardioides solisilvae]|uniref:Rv3654c family TadE-like protein n=1 Tax=Nocardioides solisilvae TaxID=1542435 RepID=UPI000D742F57|nr:Rv3654c family TadE-like protein [Nocardioides solisilvae]